MFVNLTPHVITIVPADGVEVVLPPSGQVARVQTSVEEVCQVVVDGITAVAVVKTVFGDLLGLPEPQEGVFYVTSSLVAQAAAAAGRQDVLAPDTGPTALRGPDGRIQAVRRLQIF